MTEKIWRAITAFILVDVLEVESILMHPKLAHELEVLGDIHVDPSNNFQKTLFGYRVYRSLDIGENEFFIIQKQPYEY